MMNKPVIAFAALIILGGLGVWYYLAHEQIPPPSAVVKAPPAAPPAPAEPPVAHPLPEAGNESGAAAPLPALNDSDAAFSAALGEVIGASAVKNYLEPENLIRRIVVTVDNMPRQKIPVDKRPVRGISGAFHAEGDELHATLDVQNYARYQPLVAVIRNLDMQQLAKIYVHYYPLFQSAYRDLGYPSGYFNDRLVEAIDVLVATPQVTGPIELVRPNVMYEFADRALEALPAGQKLMIRAGPDNAAAVKVKLTELRAALTAVPPRK